MLASVQSFFRNVPVTSLRWSPIWQIWQRANLWNLFEKRPRGWSRVVDPSTKTSCDKQNCKNNAFLRFLNDCFGLWSKRKKKREGACSVFLKVFCLPPVLGGPAGVPWINVVYLVYSSFPHVYLKSTTFPQGATDQTVGAAWNIKPQYILLHHRNA